MNFTLPGGGRTNRSAKQTDRKKAKRIADTFELAARQRMTDGQIRRVIADLYQEVSGSALPSSSVQDFLTAWMDRKKIETSTRTAEK